MGIFGKKKMETKRTSPSEHKTRVPYAESEEGIWFEEDLKLAKDDPQIRRNLVLFKAGLSESSSGVKPVRESKMERALDAKALELLENDPALLTKLAEGRIYKMLGVDPPPAGANQNQRPTNNLRNKPQDFRNRPFQIKGLRKKPEGGGQKREITENHNSESGEDLIGKLPSPINRAAPDERSMPGFNIIGNEDSSRSREYLVESNGKILAISEGKYLKLKADGRIQLARFCNGPKRK